MRLEYTFDLRLGTEHIRLLAFEANSEAIALDMAKRYTEDTLQYYPYLIHPTELQSIRYILKGIK